jgi:hypothetical protein
VQEVIVNDKQMLMGENEKCGKGWKEESWKYEE